MENAFTWHLAHRLDLPEESFAGAPNVTISGTERVYVTGHRGLLEYSGERVAAAARGCRILIKGERLRLEAMTERELVVSGRLWAVELE